MIDKEIRLNNEHELSLRITAVNHAIALTESLDGPLRTPEAFESLLDKIYTFYKDADSKEGNVTTLTSVN